MPQAYAVPLRDLRIRSALPRGPALVVWWHAPVSLVDLPTERADRVDGMSHLARPPIFPAMPPCVAWEGTALTLARLAPGAICRESEQAAWRGHHPMEQRSSVSPISRVWTVGNSAKLQSTGQRYARQHRPGHATRIAFNQVKTGHRTLPQSFALASAQWL
jgi:hypothetical protein